MRRRKFVLGLIVGVLYSVLLIGTCFALEALPEAERNTWFEIRTAPYRGETITVITVSGYGYDTALKFAGREFERITGTKVDVLDLPWLEMHDQIMANYLAKSGAYDVVTQDGMLVPLLFNAGALVSLEPYFKNSELTYPDLDLEDFLRQGWLEHGTWPIGETRYALPYQGDTTLLYYNTEYFNKFGQTPPETWYEYSEIAKKLTRDLNEDGRMDYGCALVAGKYPDLVVCFHNRFSALGGEWFDENYVPAVNNEIGLEALEMIEEHLKYAPPGCLEWDLPGVLRAFVKGDVAMEEMWMHMPITASDPNESNVVGKWANKVLPTAVRRAPIFGGWSIGIPAYAEKKDLSYLFIQWITEKRMMKKVVLEVGLQMARYSVLNDPDVQAKFPWYEVMVESFDAGKFFPKVAEAMEVLDAYQTYLHKFVTKGLTAKETLNQLHDALYEIMESAGYYK